jgi:toxin FitB
MLIDDSILDSNIIIYATKPEFDYLRTFIKENSPVVSAVSYVEVLGFHLLNEPERTLLIRFFGASEILEVSREIIEKAIILRQTKKMTLGDSLIAATTLVHNLTLVTNNVKDFDWVDGIKLFNPLVGLSAK